MAAIFSHFGWIHFGFSFQLILNLDQKATYLICKHLDKQPSLLPVKKHRHLCGGKCKAKWTKYMYNTNSSRVVACAEHTLHPLGLGIKVTYLLKYLGTCQKFGHFERGAHASAAFLYDVLMEYAKNRSKLTS